MNNKNEKHPQDAPGPDLPTISEAGADTAAPQGDPAGAPASGDGHVDGFRLLEEAGRGGMGVVYKAYETSLKRVVALKMLSERIAGDASVAKRFRREAILAANLSHPNIVSVLHIDSRESPRFFTMEFVQGRSVKEKVQAEGYLSSSEAARIALQAAEAVQYAHGKNILHRDIKPSNILLENHIERVRITDFGIAQDITGQLADVTAPGQSTTMTPAFASPEQNLEQELDVRTDIFSLGMTLYYMLTGRTAYDARNRQELAVAFKHQRPAPPSRLNPQVSKALDRVVMQMIAVDKQQRYPNCRRVIEDLRVFADQAAEPAPASSGPRGGRRWVRPAAIAAAMVIGVGAGLLILRAFAVDPSKSSAPTAKHAGVRKSQSPRPQAPAPAAAAPKLPAADQSPPVSGQVLAGSWRKFSGNPVISGSSHLGNPSVLLEDGVYKMWLCGDTPNRDIFYSTSADGEKWTTPKLVLARTSYAVRDPCVIKDGNQYKMWYTVNTGRGQPGDTWVEHATSADGQRWTRYGKVLSGGAAGGIDYRGIHNPEVIKEGGTYRMWYGAASGDTNAPSTICYATSADGKVWTKHRVVLRPDSSGFDASQVFPAGMFVENGTYYLLYHGYDLDNARVQLGLATSTDGMTFTRRDQPLLPYGGPSDFDNYMIGHGVCDGASVIRVGNEYKMWYGGKANQGPHAGKSSIGLAVGTPLNKSTD